MTTAAPSGLNAREADRLRKAGFPEAAIAEIDAALKRNPGFRRRRWWRFVLTGVFALAGFLIGVSGGDEWWGPAVGGALGGAVGYLAGWVVETFATEVDLDSDRFLLRIADAAIRADSDGLKTRAEALREHYDPNRPTDAVYALNRLAAAQARPADTNRWSGAILPAVLLVAALGLAALFYFEASEGDADEPRKPPLQPDAEALAPGFGQGLGPARLAIHVDMNEEAFRDRLVLA